MFVCVCVKEREQMYNLVASETSLSSKHVFVSISWIPSVKIHTIIIPFPNINVYMHSIINCQIGPHTANGPLMENDQPAAY
jgi:hypothetical protein